MEQVKEKIYVNFELITNSAEVIINMLNDRYNITPAKTIKDLKDLTYKSIYRDIDGQDVESIKKTKEYYEKLEANKEFIDLYNNTKHFIEWVIVINQDEFQNLDYVVLSTVWILKHVGDISIKRLSQPINKIQFDGIHIDFNYNNFNFNKPNHKILLTQLLDTKYNYLKGGEINTYLMHTWEDIKNTIEFFNNNKGW